MDGYKLIIKNMRSNHQLAKTSMKTKKLENKNKLMKSIYIQPIKHINTKINRKETFYLIT